MTTRTDTFLAILSELYGTVKPDEKVLDFGCGAGSVVKNLRDDGYDAYGCDINFKSDENEQALQMQVQVQVQMQEQGFLRKISTEPYLLPFDDNSFSVVISDQVFEHVSDYQTVLAEIRRVMKPGGVSLHIFPSRWRPIEPHLFIPLGGVFRPKPWLWLWALLGVRNQYQHDLTASEVVQVDADYLAKNTNYLSTAAIKMAFEKYFSEVRFVERIFLSKSHSHRGHIANRLIDVFPQLETLYRSCWQHTVFTRK